MQPNRALHDVIATICGLNVNITGSDGDVLVRINNRPDDEAIRDMVRQLELDDHVVSATPDFQQKSIRVKLV